MNKAKLKKYGFTENDEVTEDDIFLIEHHEELFYFNPKELAKAINAMNENQLLQFNENTRSGYGSNAELMREKLDELDKYMNVNMPIFGEAVLRFRAVKDHDSFLEVTEMFKKGGKRPGFAEVDTLFLLYPKFREHFPILQAKGVIEKSATKGRLKWKKTKISLAQYFEYLNNGDQCNRWTAIEKVFSKTNLRQQLYGQKEKQHSKPSPDFLEIKKILCLD
jgi:hypothetical protein